jgi:hypothetical protein
MNERDDRATIAETGSGGGAVIAGILTTALVLLGLFFLFGDQIYSGGSEKVDVNASPPQVQTPAKK